MSIRMSGKRGAAAKLRDLLDFDPGEITESEARTLVAVARALRSAPVPVPTAAETERVVVAAVACLAPPESEVARALRERWQREGVVRQALAVVAPQVHLLRRPFWFASAAVVAAGLPLLHPGWRAAVDLELTYAGFLVLVAPVLAVLGVAYAFRGIGGTAELELACPLHPVHLVLGRLCWVLAYDSALLGAASLAAAGLEPGVRLGYLVALWLAPMLLLAAGALAASRYLGPAGGAGLALAAWAGAVLSGLVRPELSLPALAGTPRGLAVSLPMLAGATGLLVYLWIASPALAERLAGGPAEAGNGA